MALFSTSSCFILVFLHLSDQVTFSQLISILLGKKQHLVQMICVFTCLKHQSFPQTWLLIWSHFLSILLYLETQRIMMLLWLSPLQVILTELYSTGFQRSFSDEDDLTAIADSDVVYAFQAPPLCSLGSSTSSHSGSHLSGSLSSHLTIFRGCPSAFCPSFNLCMLPWLFSVLE